MRDYQDKPSCEGLCRGHRTTKNEDDRIADTSCLGVAHPKGVGRCLNGSQKQ